MDNPTTTVNSKQQDTPYSAPTTQKVPATLSDSLLNGLTISLIETPWWIAMLTLVFSEPLSAYIGEATIYLIAGALVSMTLLSSFSSWKGVIWLPQDVPAAMLVIITTSIITNMPTGTSSDTLFVTIVVTIALTSMLTGVGMYLMGALQLGKWVRILPFPVVAGFLGGTGCLMLMGGINSSVTEQIGADLLTYTAILHWVPCVLLALLIYGLGRYIKHALLIPLMMLLASLVFFGISKILGASLAELNASGLLFNAIPSSDKISWLSWEQFSNVQWLIIFEQADLIIVLVLASIVAMLLNNSGFELSVRGSFDHNKDLRTTGIANFMAGMVGGWPGYMSPAWSSINARQGKQLPLTGLIVAIISGLLLWYSTQLMAFIPRFVVGSAVAYVGISFLFDWVVIPAKRLAWKDFGLLLMVVILVVLLGQ